MLKDSDRRLSETATVPAIKMTENLAASFPSIEARPFTDWTYY
jgi:hypothetical protein